MGHEVIVADAKRLKLLWDTKSKDDKRDARFLAEIAARCPDFLCPVEPRTLESEQNRALLRMRESVVRARVKLINCLRGVLASFGEKLPAAASEGFANKVRPLLPDELRAEAHPALLAVEFLTAEIKVYDKQVLELCNGRNHGARRRDPSRCRQQPQKKTLQAEVRSTEQTKRLLTIRGVGPLTARKLAVLLHTLWRKDVDFDPAFGLEQAA